MLGLMSVLVLSNFTSYPAFGDRITGLPGPTRPALARVEAAVDKGPIIELIVRCPEGTGIISYSKLERVYCSSRAKCSPQIAAAVHDTCK